MLLRTLVLVALSFALPALCAERVLNASHISVELVPEFVHTEPMRPVAIGVRFVTEQGWHIYWTNPGDSGAAPKFSWSFDGKQVVAALLWPVPKRIPVGPLMNFGYDGETLIMAELPGVSNAGEHTLELDLEWLVCKEDCIPGSGVLQIGVGIQDGQPISTKWHKLFTEVRIQQPKTFAKEKNLAFFADGMYTIQLPREPLNTEQIEFFPARPGEIEHAASQILEADKGLARIKLQGAQSRNSPVNTLSGILVYRLAEEIDAYSVDTPVQSLPLIDEDSSAPSLIMALFLALLGGIVLNLMPCVLPVLALKVFSLLESQKADVNKRRKHALSYAAGILVSMWLLAGVLALARHGGEALGWGFQLQTPGFIAFLAVIVFLCGLNLSGVFEIGASVQQAASSFKLNSSLSGSFLHGVLAVLLATPCTAPFMGTAIVYALNAPLLQSAMVFSCLGLGLAAPYVGVVFSPRLARILPKPGAWMETFKQLLAFPLYATVVWLLWVLGVQRGPDSVIVLLVTLLLAAFAAWQYGKFSHPLRSAKVRFVSMVVVVISVFAGFILVKQTLSLNMAQNASPYGVEWEVYSTERLQALRQQGRIVLLDFTAAWCVTCHLNKRLVFGSERVRKVLTERQAVVLRADWTDRNPQIAQALMQYGKQSVPLNVLYLPEKLEPIVLPSILTPALVLSYLE